MRKTGAGTRTRPAMVLALCAALALGGCVSLPTAKSPGSLSSQTAGPGADVRIWPQAPNAADSPSQIVEEFLQAAVATATEPTGAGQGQPQFIADEYLTGQAQKSWDPGEVSVFSNLNSVTELTDGVSCNGADNCYGFTGNLVGDVDDQSMYTAAPPVQSAAAGATQSVPYAFHVTQNAKHIYQIDQVQPGFGAALTQEDFAASYSNYNLYYLNQAAPTKSLVPVPVYLRSSVSDQAQATTLADDLFGDEPSWIAPIARNSAAKPTLKALSIQPSNGMATVAVGQLGDCTGNEQVCYNLAVQLLATFTGIASINGVTVCTPDGTCSQAVFPNDLQFFGLGTNSRLPSTQPVAYYLDPASHQVWSLAGTGKGQAAKVGAATAQYGQLSVSPPNTGQNQLAALTNPAATELSIGYPNSAINPVQHYAGTSVGSLSWDDFGKLWFTDTAADGTVQVLRMDTSGPQVAVQQVGFIGLNPDTAVKSVAIAPDGQRLAVVLQGPASTYNVDLGIVQQVRGKWIVDVGSDANQIANSWSNVSQVAWRDGTVLGVLGSPQSAAADTIWELHSDGSQVVDPSTQELLNIGPPKNLVSFGWAANGELLAATQAPTAAPGATAPPTSPPAADPTLLSFSNAAMGWTLLGPGTLGNLPPAAP
ncbi:MAG TPA: LpqB family beta-propeller domain-containing protein [Actinocrinis sp.]|nr:LpqB family beta-propeller domain-containing protein [Actinocrinis sp.]